MKQLIYIGNKLEDRGGAPTFADGFIKLLREEGFKVESASSLKNKVLRLLHMLLTILKNASNSSLVLIDTYSTQNFWYAVNAARLCRILQLDYIPVLHGGQLQNRLKSHPKQCKELFSGAKINVVPSPFLFGILKEYGVDKLTCVPNSIPVKNYRFRHRDSVAPRIFWLRAFDEIYNPLLAIKILERLIEKYPEAELCMVGPEKDGSLEHCREYVKTKGLPVKLTGKLSKPEWTKLSEGYDIFLNTSGIDNMPLSIVEAMALGFPVVSSNAGGIPHIIESGETGLLIETGDIDGFTAAIDFLLKNPSETSKISLSARDKAKTFDWTKVKADWLQLLS